MTTSVRPDNINTNAYVRETDGGKEQLSKSVTVTMGDKARTITLGNNQTTPSVLTKRPDDPPSAKPHADRQIAVADAAKPQQKQYNFTFKQLEAICNGKYNVGEIALDKKGRLTKINNHVHYSDRNTVVTTPEENARLRQQAYQCIADKYKDNPGILADVRDILLGEGRENLSLSRDELGLLLKGIKDGLLETDYGTPQLITSLENIRKFKTGDWEEAPWLRTANESVEHKTGNDFMTFLKDRGLVKGLNTDFGNDVVCRISVNAKRDVARSLLGGCLERQNADSWGMVSAAKLLQLTYQATLPDWLSERENPVQYDLAAKKFDDRLLVYKEDVRPLADEAMKRLDEENVPPANYKKKLAERMLQMFEDLCTKSLERRNPAHANPGQLLVDNAQPNAKKSYVRQTFCHCGKDGKPTWFGSQFCFFNSVVNAVMAGNDSKSLARLRKMFTPTGFKLHDDKGVLKEYTYDSPDLPKNGNFSVYEESLNKHFKLLKGPQYNYGAGGTSEAAKALGMQEVDQPAQTAYGYAVDNRGKEITDPATLKQLQQNYVNELAGHLQSGKFVTYNEEGHFVAVRGIELHEDGSVKLSIVDDRANVKGEYEYDKTYTAAQFKALCQGVSFSVLEWQPEKENV